MNIRNSFAIASALARWADQIALRFDANTFEIGGGSFGSENDALIFATANPADKTKKLLVIAGNGALGTVKAVHDPMNENQYTVLNHGKVIASGFID